MNDVQVVSDGVVGGVRVAHYLCYGEPPYAAGLPAGLIALAGKQPLKERRWKDADIPSIEHLEVRWRACEMVTAQYYCDGWLVTRRRLAQVGFGGDLRDTCHAGLDVYLESEHRLPGYAWLRNLPNGVNEFDELVFGKTRITVMVENWVPADMVMLGNGGGKVAPVYIGCKEIMEVVHE